MAGEPSALAELCRELPDLRRECAGQPEQRRVLLRRIEMLANRGEPIAAVLAELLGAEIGDITRSLSVALPGRGGGGLPDTETYGCPLERCARRERPLPAGVLPRCHVADAPMRRR